MAIIGALEAGGTKMVCAIGDENGNIFKQESIKTTTPQETIPQLLSWFENEKIDALGIGCFGPVDLNKKSPSYGHITTTPKPGWKDCDVVGAFKKFNVPIGFDLDVNASAIGEYTWGIGKGLDSIVYVTIGTGVGAGVIVDGKLLHGMIHPEAGHMLLTRHPDDLSYKGHCPYHSNCVEGLCAGPSLIDRWGKSGAELSDDAKVWEIEGYYLAQMCVDYAMCYSPQRIILGGGVMHQTQLFPIIRRNFKELLGGYLKSAEIDDLDNYIVVQSLDDKQGIMGAIKLGVDAMV